MQKKEEEKIKKNNIVIGAINEFMFNRKTIWKSLDIKKSIEISVGESISESFIR